jgi:hypothetical protein
MGNRPERTLQPRGIVPPPTPAQNRECPRSDADGQLRYHHGPKPYRSNAIGSNRSSFREKSPPFIGLVHRIASFSLLKKWCLCPAVAVACQGFDPCPKTNVLK